MDKSLKITNQRSSKGVHCCERHLIKMREKGVEIVNKRINAKRTKVNKDKRITYIATKVLLVRQALEYNDEGCFYWTQVR